MKGYKVPEHMIDGLKNWIDRFPSDDKYAWGMNAIVDEIEALPLEELDDNWHTGNPTEDGWYLCKSEHMIGYDVGYYANGRFNRLHCFNQDDITEWKNIEP